eukprot:scaffold77507_cov69-Phaeocystis_antarctica.AAC.1
MSHCERSSGAAVCAERRAELRADGVVPSGCRRSAGCGVALVLQAAAPIVRPEEVQPAHLAAAAEARGERRPARARRQPKLTCTPRGLRTVRTGYAYQPPACCTYQRRRAAAVRVPAPGVPYVPRTVALQATATPTTSTWDSSAGRRCSAGSAASRASTSRAAARASPSIARSSSPPPRRARSWG